MSFTAGAGTRFLLSTDSSGTISPSGPLSIAGGTATANTPVLSATQTWNNAAVTFTGWRLNVTDTASNAASLLLDLQVGGTSRFQVSKSGSVRSLGKTISLTDGTYEIFLERAPSGYSSWGGRLFFLEGEIKWGSSAYLSFIGTGATSKWLFSNSGIMAASGGIGVFASHTGSLGFQTYGSTTDYAAIASAHTDNNNSGLIFRARSAGTNSEAARITSSGNVGIGTTSPAGTGQRIVQIAGVGGGVNQYGSLSLSNASGSGNNLLGSVDYYAASTLISSIRSIVTGGGNTGDLRFFTSNGGTLSQRASISLSGFDVGGFVSAKNPSSGNETTGLLVINNQTGTGSNISVRLASIANNGAEYDLGKIVGYKTGVGAATVSGGLIFSTNDNSTSATERMRLDPSGNVVVNTAAIATTATDGFLYVPSCAGTPTGTPTTYTGRVPIVVDTTNNKMYFYSGGVWRDAGP